MEDPSPDVPIALIVDDDASILAILERMVRVMKPITTQTIVFARSYAEALELILNYKVATVLTDYTLDEGDGLQLIRRIKQRFPEAVTILSTGLDQAELSVGEPIELVDYYLPKPYTIHDLAEVLGAALY